ncbi:MAG: Holliday junction branch migration protein RuvA [Oligoflexia bacterium]|nr:Holliday junction branch migration protein RuvA [Oligoflexia bacterium]
MIGSLRGKVIDRFDHGVIIEVLGVGYEVFCSQITLEALSQAQGSVLVYTFAQYRSEGVSLFGFLTPLEKTLFLNLIKVDTVGPKSALHILSGAPCSDLVQMIDGEDVQALAKLPKVSKKTAELVVVKLKGKLKDLVLTESAASLESSSYKPGRDRKLRIEAISTLGHLGYRTQDVERVLDQVEENYWTEGLESVIRRALGGLSGQS